MTTDIKKIIVYFAFGMVCLLLYEAWQKDYPVSPQTTVTRPQPHGVFVPEEKSPPSDTKPQPSSQHALPQAPQERLLEIKSQVLELQIDRRDGNVVQAKLPRFPLRQQQPDIPLTLLDQSAQKYYQAQSGLLVSGKHQIVRFTAEQSRWQVTQQPVTVTLHGSTSQGVKVIKSFHVAPEDYLLTVRYQLTNNSPTVWHGNVFNQLVRKIPASQKSSMFGISSYQGGAISDPNGKIYEKVPYKKMQQRDLDRLITGGWAALQQHYFLSAWIPAQQARYHYYSHAQDDLVTLGFVGPEMVLRPGETKTTSQSLYIGPENTERLAEIAKGLDFTIDYGLLWFLAFPMFKVMKAIHHYVGNWGWSIIIITLLIKLLFYKLSEASYRSMASMKKMAPRLQQIKERYADDRQKLSEATMALYKEEKINPFGGCLPILIQVPFFIALYWVLIESVELRHAPFMLWLRDLSSPDPYFILPIIMGGTMLLQQRLNPGPQDPTQQKVMMLLPVMFTGLFLFFPAGLVLYWVVNNGLSILQQWYINRKYESKLPTGKR